MEKWISFHTDDGDTITLEKDTLERGLVCLEETKELNNIITEKNRKKDKQTLGGI